MLAERLQVNNEAFYYDYRDLFAQSFNLGTALLTTFNAEQVEIYGNQLDLLLQATDVDRMNLSVGYLRARGDVRYESTFWDTFAQNRGTQQEAYTKSDASLTYLPDGDRWSVGLWVRNIEDEAVQAATTAGQFGPYAVTFLEPPRTYGIRLTARL